MYMSSLAYVSNFDICTLNLNQRACFLQIKLLIRLLNIFQSFPTTDDFTLLNLKGKICSR